MRQSGEPSVEEILESIKKVIARDNRVGAAEQRRQRVERGVREVAPAIPVMAGQDDDEVLDLGASGAFFDAIDDHANDDAFADDAGDDGADAYGDSPLLAEDTRASMRDSLAALAMMAQPGVAPQIVRSGETSLEGLARELLRPALTEWLDRNLPPLVERMVAAEIARIVGKKG
jgi:hypothetical protein